VDLTSIITADFSKNHANREYDERYVHDIVAKYREIGGTMFVSPNVVTFYEPKDPYTVEFHCMNGGSGKDLTEAVNAFLEFISTRYTYACTFYDNPRISELAKYVKFPVSVDYIDDGIDRAYKMSFNLGGI
jgi:hypothetical protein